MDYRLIVLVLPLLLLSGCLPDNTVSSNGILNNTLLFANGAYCTDNSTAYVCYSPDGSNWMEIGNNNSFHFFSNGVNTMNVTPQGIEVESCIGCGSGGNGSSLWDSNSTDIYPIDSSKNLYIDKNMSVDSLFIRAGQTMHLGNDATFSEEQVFFSAVNATLSTIVLNTGLTLRSSFNGTILLTNLNLNEDPNALAITSSGDFEGNGMANFKWNKYHFDPYLAQSISLRGNMDVITTWDNNFSLTGSNEVRFGGYSGLSVENQTATLSVDNKEFNFVLNQTQTTFYKKTDFLNYSIYHVTEDADVPTPVGDEILEYFKENGKKYQNSVARGQRRYVDAVGGSIVIDEHLIVHNATTLNGTITFPQLSDGYLCISGGVVYSDPVSCP